MYLLIVKVLRYVTHFLIIKQLGLCMIFACESENKRINEREREGAEIDLGIFCCTVLKGKLIVLSPEVTWSTVLIK